MSKHKTITIHSRLAMDSAYHAAGLHKLCRVCGDSLARAFRVQHRCAEEKHTKNLMKVFGIDVSTDDPSIHPESFCHKCQNVIYVAVKRADEGREYTPRVILFDRWVEHSADGCSVCQHISKVQRGGSKKKVKAGHPARVPVSRLFGTLDPLRHLHWSPMLVATTTVPVIHQLPCQI